MEHRHDLVGEGAGLDRRQRPAVGLGRVAVLVLAADVVLLGTQVVGDAHVEVVDDVPQPVVDHVVLDRPRPHAVAEARLLEVIGCGAHVLHAAGHHHVGVPGLDGLGGEHHGLECRTADLVDGESLHLPGHLGEDGRLLGRVLAVAAGQHLAHDDLVHRRLVDPRPLDGRLDDDGAELGGARSRPGCR